jgi:hypothetical protein
MTSTTFLQRILVSLTCVIALVGTATTRPAAASTLVPFQAVVNGTAPSVACATAPLCLSVTDTGHATALGATTLTKAVQIVFTGQSCANGAGAVTTYSETDTLVAANGDTLFVQGSGVACHTAAGTLAAGSYRVTGGTGRLAGATGSGTELIVSSTTGPTTASETTHMAGTLSTPGA